jgi:hypothetical protein
MVAFRYQRPRAAIGQRHPATRLRISAAPDHGQSRTGHPQAGPSTCDRARHPGAQGVVHRREIADIVVPGSSR